MKINQAAAQLYTLRNYLKTPDDIASSLRKVREIGYEAVQVSGMGPIAEEELMKILDGEGLVCCATHEPTQQIFEETSRVVERLQKLNCQYTAVPIPGSYPTRTLADVEAFTAKMNDAGKVLADNGQVLTYHNHHNEFRHIEGQTILERFYNGSDPKYLQGEIDTYWVQFGGGNPADWCRRLQNRLPLIHLKDYGIDDDDKPVFREIGYGNLNFKEIVTAAEEAGCLWYIVEQDTTPGDPFDSLRMSFEYIRDNLCA